MEVTLHVRTAAASLNSRPWTRAICRASLGTRVLQITASSSGEAVGAHLQLLPTGSAARPAASGACCGFRVRALQSSTTPSYRSSAATLPVVTHPWVGPRKPPAFSCLHVRRWLLPGQRQEACTGSSLASMSHKQQQQQEEQPPTLWRLQGSTWQAQRSLQRNLQQQQQLHRQQQQQDEEEEALEETQRIGREGGGGTAHQLRQGLRHRRGRSGPGAPARLRIFRAAVSRWTCCGAPSGSVFAFER
mmetsp:Transcript_7155/g.16255  ORF Transcript_7155/g.16255 Transcript_7155/m.16255 type:complete len:246 (-) Transcript_7155:476-1213(-)